MKTKKQKSGSRVIVDSTAAGKSTGVDIKSLVRDHSLFFDKLVELIPAKFYLSTDQQDKPWFQGLSKAAKAEAKLKSIENTKKSRRERLDPAKSSKTTLDFLKESLNTEKSDSSDDDDDDDDGSEKAKVSNLDGDGRRSVTYEELRQRLHKRIEELRAGRGGGGGGGVEKEAERREKREDRKRKRDEKGLVKGRERNGQTKKTRENERDSIEKEVSEAAKGIEFGKVKLRADNEDVSHSKNKKRKLSKEKELERALKLEEAKQDPENGEMVAKKHSWRAATERAMGIKVHDNPKLLKQSLHKEKKKHKKSIEKWKNRVDTTEKMKKDKQEKRKGNIKAKIDQKKQKKIEKREKKLMRPGFEGRKEGFVNGN